MWWTRRCLVSSLKPRRLPLPPPPPFFSITSTTIHTPLSWLRGPLCSSRGWGCAWVAVDMAREEGGYCRLRLGLLLCFLAGAARGDFASDQKECGDKLIGLSTCLPYVGGSSKSPTPDCCSGLKQVVGKSPRCLCILIKDRDDPQLGLKIDVNRAMTLPSLCASSVNITQCIDLLKLPPNSKEAEVFKQFSDTLKNATGKGAPSSSSSPATGAAKPQGSSGGVGTSHLLGRRWVGVDVVVGGHWVTCLLVLSLVILGG